MNNPFEYHQPDHDETARIEDVRESFANCLLALNAFTMPGSVSGRYRALATTALEQACMWATKSIVVERDNA